jgi:hypothetical protein
LVSETWFEAFLMNLAFCPDEGCGGLVVAGDEGVDMGDELGDACKGCARERLACEDREPDFDLVEPGSMGRRVVEPDVLMTLQPHVSFGLVRREIVEHHVDFAIPMSGDDLVHEVEELDPSASLVVPADDFAAGQIKGRKERRRAVPRIVVGLARHGAPARQFQVTLRPFERLDRRLFVDGQHDGVVRRRHVEPDDLGRLGNKVGIVAFTPGFAAGKVNLLSAKKPPDILNVDVAQSLGQQRPAPVGVALRRFFIEKRQNARIVPRPVFGLRAPLACLVEARHPSRRIANPPFGRCADRAADRSRDFTRRRAIARHQHDPGALARAVLAFRRTRHTLKVSAFLASQNYPRRFRDALHASLNHDSRIRDSGY